MAYAAAATCSITNLFPGECYPRTHSVVVSYLIPSGIGTVRLRCSCGGTVVPNPNPPTFTGPAGGTVTFTITHNGTGTGHRIISDIVIGMSTYPGDEVTVNVGDPCPLSVRATDKYEKGYPIVDVSAALSGTYNSDLGDGILILVEDLEKSVEGTVPRPLLIFASPAILGKDGDAGTWRHPPIKKVKKDQYLRVVLTKEGAVVTSIRAVVK